MSKWKNLNDYENLRALRFQNAEGFRNGNEAIIADDRLKEIPLEVGPGWMLVIPAPAALFMEKRLRRKGVQFEVIPVENV